MNSTEGRLNLLKIVTAGAHRGLGLEADQGLEDPKAGPDVDLDLSLGPGTGLTPEDRRGKRRKRQDRGTARDRDQGVKGETRVLSGKGKKKAHSRLRETTRRRKAEFVLHAVFYRAETFLVWKC